jgi:adenylate cyclase
MGLPVNIASRLQSATKKLNNSLVVSKQVYDLLSPKSECQQTQAELKGLTGTYSLFMCGDPYHL